MKRMNRRAFQKTATVVAAFSPLLGRADQKQTYEPTLESLRQYECPEWFRDAKIGFWSHWGPQAAPEQGDWYAKGMYIPKGQPGARGQYETHVKRYGHPSEFGYKDILPTWKAEKFTPAYADFLMELYKKAGGKYFTTTVHHHDNVDLWDSKTHRWNCVDMGPMKDVTQIFQDAAKRAGLKFGIASHLNNSETWWGESKNADLSGPKAGVLYDGANPEFQDLYHPVDQQNYNWEQKWYVRVSEIVKKTNPDILWFDCKQVPYAGVGAQIISDYYNARPDGVCALKQLPGKYAVSELSVQDYEYGVPFDLKPDPWLSDSFIGHWFWNSKFEDGDIPHVSSEFLVRYLVDAVSKNGNVLIVVPQRSDGTVHDTVVENLLKLGAWLEVNGEGIYATRPFRVFGEGPPVFSEADMESNLKRGYDYSKFNSRTAHYVPGQLRYTQSKDGKTLYAFGFGHPASGKVLFTELAEGKTPRAIKSVQLLGSNAEIKWIRTSRGLEVELPSELPFSEAYGLKLTLAPGS